MFLTLGRGLQRGVVLFSRCYTCDSVFGGCWKWRPVKADCPLFPDGYHRPVSAIVNPTDFDVSRWFFATPSIVIEGVLMKLFASMLLQTSTTFSALSAIYAQLWGSTLQGTLLSARHHFVKRVEMAWLSYRSYLLLAAAGPEHLRACKWHLRPHHEPPDFNDLLRAVADAFRFLGAVHSCDMCKPHRIIVVDCKVIEPNVCAEMASESLWDPQLALGCVVGCSQRPEKGGVFCHAHAATWSCQDPGCHITKHRERSSADGVSLEFLVDGTWQAAAHVHPAAARRYEVSRLKTSPARSSEASPSAAHATLDADAPEPPPCREGLDVPEHSVPRRLAGVVIAVSPCLQIVDLDVVRVHESLTQVVLFVFKVLQSIPTLAFIVYDFACGARRFMRRQAQASHRRATGVQTAWRLLQNLIWVCDRLHYQFHKCRDSSEPSYLPEVNPHIYEELRGIDSEAAEQIFSIVERWSTRCRWSAPQHFHLSVLLLSHHLNEHARCDAMLARMLEARSATGAADKRRQQPCVPEISCDDSTPPCSRRPGRRPFTSVVADCFPCTHCPASGPDDISAPPPRPVSGTVATAPRTRGFRSLFQDESVVLNAATRTVHPISFPGCDCTDCGWQYALASAVETTPRSVMRESTHTVFACGTCCGVRVPLALALLPE